MIQVKSNPELEKKVLATAFLSPESAHKLLELSRESDFHNSKHKLLYKAIKSLYEAGREIDFNSLIEKAGIEFAVDIADLGNLTYTDAMLIPQIRELRELSHKRKLSLLLMGEINLETFKALYREIESEQVATNPFVSSDEINKVAIDYYRLSADPGLSTGWKSVDEYFRVAKGLSMAVGGIPNHGKSEFVDALFVNLAKLHDWRFIIFSPENYPIRRHIKKLVEKYAEMPFFEGYNLRLSEHDLRRSLIWINEHFCFMDPDLDNINLDYILQQAQKMMHKRKIDSILIDPWNEIMIAKPKDVSETDYVLQCLQKIRYFARKNDVLMWHVIHPQKLLRDRTGNYPVPTPYDMHGSAYFRNKLDSIITIYRPDMMRHEIEVHIQKMRIKDYGHVGMTKLAYHYETGRFFEV